MTRKPEHWTPHKSLTVFDLRGAPLHNGLGWSFWSHPTLGDKAPILAVSLDFIGPQGPIVYNTGDFHLPETL